VIARGTKLPGGFVVEATIASSAFSATYRATQSALGRAVWIKALKSTVSVTSPYARALEREAHALASLATTSSRDAAASGFVIALYDFVKTDESAWLVLEDLRGPSLADVMGKGPIALDHAMALGVLTARAVARLHARGLVHRDLRDAHVRIEPGPVAKLVELGRALPIGETDPADAIEEPITLDHIAPEQRLGAAASPRADVYSLGMLLAKLAERTPNEGPRSEPLARVLSRATAQEPLERHADAADLAEALDTVLRAFADASTPVLVQRALAAAKLADDPTDALMSERPLPLRVTADPAVARAARGLGLIFGLVVVGGVALEVGRDDRPAPEERPGMAAPISKDRGYLRVLAHPWAQVVVDGDVVETTPFARPIPLTPGKHFVTLKHPTAPDEQRTIKLAGGETVLLDVTMRVARDMDAGRVDAAIVDDP
jgi:serine/threonine-protein kinase